jgi:hypothetical protein
MHRTSIGPGRSRIVLGVDEIRGFLASDAGRKFRRVLAAGVVVTAPLLVRLAEALRDWEPQHPRPIVIDV